MTVPRIAPLEGDRISTGGALLPDFIAPREHKFFIDPRWRVRVLVDCQCGDFSSALVKVHEWISAADASSIIMSRRRSSRRRLAAYPSARSVRGPGTAPPPPA